MFYLQVYTMHFITVIKNTIYLFFSHINIKYYKIQFILQTYTIYFFLFFFTHKYIQLQNRIHFTFTLVNI